MTRWLRTHKQLVAVAAIFCTLGLGALLYHDRRITLEQATTTAQLGMTRKALLELLDLAGSSLAYVPNTEILREGLAKLVLVRYQELGDKFRSDPGVRLEMAQVHRVIGGIRRITGQFEDSRRSYNQSVELLERLCVDDPSRAEYREWLAQTLIDRGELFHMNGESDLSERDFRQAIVQAEKLPGMPSSSIYRRRRASALINLSEILMLKDQFDQARKAADQAVDLLQPLADTAKPTEITPFDRWLLSMALTDRGTASMEAGQPTAAAQDLDLAEAVANRIVGPDQKSDDAQFQLGCVYCRRGELIGLDPARLAAAEQQFGQAARLLEDLVGIHNAVPHYREELAVTLAGRAAVRAALGTSRLSDAQHDYEAARKHLEGLIDDQKRKGARLNPQHLSLLSRTLANGSRVQLALGRTREGSTDLVQAFELMQQAIGLDPARARSGFSRSDQDPAS